MDDFIPYGRQSISDLDIGAVVSVLKSDFLTQGPCVPQFESAVAANVGSIEAVAFNSATSALHAACLALGLKSGDRIWTSPISFVASANCGLYCGAKVDFVDIDPETFNMSASALAQKLKIAETQGNLPKIVVPVHMAGQSCDMKEIARLSSEYGFKIIEDASHAIGGYYNEKAVGCCLYSDITVFSFHPVKIITSAEGGMATTNDTEIAQKLRLYCSHGVTRDPSLLSVSEPDPWYYEQIALGFNYRMTELQAALGNSQLQRLKPFIERRRFLAARYDRLLANLPILPPIERPDRKSAFHLYIIQLSSDSNIRKQVFSNMRTQGIGVNVHYIPIYKQPYYQSLGFKEAYCENAESYYRGALSLPLYYDLSEGQQDRVVDTLAGILKEVQA